MTHKTLVFDFGGVIFDTSATEFYQKLFQQKGRSTKELDYFLKTIFTAKDRSVSNTGNAKDIIDVKSAIHPEWADEIRAYGADRDFIKTVRGLVPGAKDLLAEMKQQGHRLVGLTNWHGDTYDVLAKVYPDIINYFDTVVVSGKTGLRKPMKDIFQLAQAVYGNPKPAKTLYFDDKPANIQAAADAVGWSGFVFEDTNTVRRALAPTPKPF